MLRCKGEPKYRSNKLPVKTKAQRRDQGFIMTEISCAISAGVRFEFP